MTVDELIAAAKPKGPWRLNGEQSIRTVANPPMCPITAVAGGETQTALTVAVQRLAMTPTDALNLIEAADLTSTQLKLYHQKERVELRQRLENELLGHTPDPDS